MRSTFRLRFHPASILTAAWLASSVGALAQPATNTPPLSSTAARTFSATNDIWLTFGLNRLDFLQARPFAGVPLWQILASALYILLAFYAAKFFDYFIRVRVRQWAVKSGTKLDPLLVDLVRGPVKVVSFVILLHIGMEVYSWPATWAHYLSMALKIIVACSITYVLLKAIDLLIGVWRERTTTPENEQFSKQLLPLISKSLKVFLLLVAVLETSQELGLHVTSLIASLSIGGLALGLAAQDTLGNLFGAVAVLVDKPFHVGDEIKLADAEGTVESIGFRSTRVRNPDGNLVTIPNKTVGNATITNMTQRTATKTVMNLRVPCDTPVEKVQRAVTILEEILKPHPMTADFTVCFNKFEGSSLNLQVVHSWNSTDSKAYLQGLQSFNLEIKRRFEAEGIEFAFPAQTIYLKQAPAERAAAPCATTSSPSAARPRQ